MNDPQKPCSTTVHVIGEAEERREQAGTSAVNVGMSALGLSLAGYKSGFSFRNKLARVLWRVAYLLLYRPSPRPCHGWRRFLLRRFGAKIGAGAHPYPTVRIWAPWNLEMGDHSCLADGVECYCVAIIRLGRSALVSQRSFLCTASHDHNDPAFRLVTKPITIADGAWVAAEAFVAPGVTVSEGAVAGARSVVTKNVEPWTVVAGNPARVIGKRVLCVVAEGNQDDS